MRERKWVQKVYRTHNKWIKQTFFWIKIGEVKIKGKRLSEPNFFYLGKNNEKFTRKKFLQRPPALYTYHVQH